MTSRAWLTLTAAQQGIWLGQQLDPHSPAYNTAEYIRLTGPLNHAALAAAITQTLEEAETLHGVVQLQDGQPRLRIQPRLWTVQRIDCQASADPAATARAWMEDDLAQPCDLGRDSWFATALLTLSASETWWYLRAHHIALDGYSFALLARQVAAAYVARTTGGAAPQPGGSLEAVLTEDAVYAASPQQAADQAFWRARFATLPPPVSLSAATALPATRSLRYQLPLPVTQAALTAALPGAPTAWLDAVVAAVVAYVAGWTGAHQVVLGLPLMSRIGSASLRVPCMAMNIIPLALTVQPEHSLAELARSVAAERVATRPHARYRYEHLRRDLGLTGAGRRLFGPVVNVMPFERPQRFGPLQAAHGTLSAGPVEDLAFNITLRDGALELTLEGNPGCYTLAALEFHAANLARLLAAWVADPQQPLAAQTIAPSLALLDGGPLPAALPSFVQRLRDHAAHQPNAAALVEEDQTWSYAALLAQAEAWAGQLAQRGAGSATLVAVCMPRSAAQIVAVLAVLLTGAAYVPLDPQWPTARLHALLDQAQPVLVLTSAALAVQHSLTQPWLDPQTLAAPDAGWRTPDIAPADAAYVLFTSGSTGTPKGVVISHAALSAFVYAAGARYGLAAPDRVLQFAPLHFDASVEEIFGAFGAGATLVLRNEQMLESLQQFCAACARLAISVLDLPTAFWHELALSVAQGAVALPACVRCVIIGGEAALPERVRGWLAAVGPQVQLFNTYGPTEATVVATVAELRDPEQPVAIGRPLPGVQALLLDPGGHPVLPGATGELWLLGAGLATGYLNRPDLDARAFAALAQLPGAPRAYRTGDLAWCAADGQLVFAGRVDDEFKISGQRVAPAEIEHILAEHPAVLEAAVAGQTLPGGARRLVAAVVGAAGATTAALREHARAHLAPAAVPSVWLLLERLPRTSSGKIDRRALLELAPAPAQPRSAASLEAIVRAAWSAVLGLSDLPGAADFFALGGTSLHVIQVASRLSLALQREITAATVFQAPTIDTLTQALAQLAAALPATVSDTPDVSADATLELTLQPAATRPAALQTVLLTGATGFLGAHVLAELLRTTAATVICLVRASAPAVARERLATVFARYNLPLSLLDGRLEVWPADLSQPELGLDPARWLTLGQRCDVILHCAAVISVMRDYSSLRTTNVQAVGALLRLAAVRGAALHHVSTLAVAPPLTRLAQVPEGFVGPHSGLRDGYTQSKWAAERLLEQAAQRGFALTVLRPGRIVGGAGSVDPGDLFWRIVRASALLGAFPALELSEIWNPVDSLAAALVTLAQQPEAQGVYNAAPHAPLSYRQLHAWLVEYGYALEWCALPEWCARLRAVAEGDQRNTLAFFERVLAGDAPEPPGVFVAERLTTALAQADAALAAVDRAAFFQMLAGAVAAGWLAAPAQSAAVGQA